MNIDLVLNWCWTGILSHVLFLYNNKSCSYPRNDWRIYKCLVIVSEPNRLTLIATNTISSLTLQFNPLPLIILFIHHLSISQQLKLPLIHHVISTLSVMENSIFLILRTNKLVRFLEGTDLCHEPPFPKMILQLQPGIQPKMIGLWELRCFFLWEYSSLWCWNIHIWRSVACTLSSFGSYNDMQILDISIQLRELKQGHLSILAYLRVANYLTEELAATGKSCCLHIPTLCFDDHKIIVLLVEKLIHKLIGRWPYNYMI